MYHISTLTHSPSCPTDRCRSPRSCSLLRCGVSAGGARGRVELYATAPRGQKGSPQKSDRRRKLKPVRLFPAASTYPPPSVLANQDQKTRGKGRRENCFTFLGGGAPQVFRRDDFFGHFVISVRLGCLGRQQGRVKR